jgi:polyphosphate kinase
MYGDLSYLTSKEDYGADATAFFNTITGYSQPCQYRLLEAAPINLHKKIITLIESEAERSRQGQKTHITAKMNSLSDTRIIKALYAASQAGVKIDLNIRGVCCLRPGVKNLSDNIRVISIVDRFLEHARILSFHNGGDKLVFISSADWMPRNLDRRVELLVPITDAEAKKRCIRILETHLSDTVNAWELKNDGHYERLTTGAKKKPVRSQEELYLHVCAMTEQNRQPRIEFEPLRPPAQSG